MNLSAKHVEDLGVGNHVDDINTEKHLGTDVHFPILGSSLSTLLW